MELHIGRDILKPVYYERRKSWYISRNDREALYNKDNVWIEFETEKEAEDYLEKLANYYHYAELLG